MDKEIFCLKSDLNPKSICIHYPWIIKVAGKALSF